MEFRQCLFDYQQITSMGLSETEQIDDHPIHTITMRIDYNCAGPWSRANKDKGRSVWLVCDGPVDTIQGFASGQTQGGQSTYFARQLGIFVTLHQKNNIYEVLVMKFCGTPLLRQYIICADCVSVGMNGEALGPSVLLFTHQEKCNTLTLHGSRMGTQWLGPNSTSICLSKHLEQHHTT